MTVSFAQPATLACPACKASFGASIWLIVAADERPDLIEHIRAGALHTVTCPHCGQAVNLDAPLLIFRPAAEPPILFSPAEQTTGEEDREQAAALVGLLRERLGSTWSEAWLARGVPGVPRALLPIVFADDLAVALRDMQAQMQHALNELRERDPETFARLEVAAQQAMEALRTTEDEPDEATEGDNVADVATLIQALNAFLSVRSWLDSYRQVQAHPDLLSDEALALLDRAITVARAAGNTDAVAFFEEHLALLRRCREIGVNAAFAEKLGVAVEQLEDFDAVANMLPDVLAVMQELARDGPIASLEELERRLAARPDLRERLERAATNTSFPVPAAFTSWLTAAQQAELRFRQTGDRGALTTAVEAWNQILGHPELRTAPPNFRLAVLNDAGGFFLRRYWEQGQTENLEQAIALWQQAVAATPPDSPYRPSILTNLGNGLRDRYARTGRLDDLEQALALWQQAVAATPPDSPDRPRFLTNLGIGLHARYERTGRLDDLEQALALRQQAVAATPPDSPDRPRFLTNLGIGLHARYERTGRLDDLEQALALRQQAVAATPPDSPDRPSRLTNLGNGLRDRYARTGRLNDLEQALALRQQAVAATPPDSPDRPSRLTNLGNGLRDRYARTGRLDDLEQALAAYQQAVAATPPDSPDRPSRLTNLGNGLRDRYARTGRLDDLEQALALWQQAVAATPPDSPDRPSRLTNLGNGLRDRYARTGRLDDLEQALALWQQAVAANPPDSPDRPRFLSNLGNGLRDRYERTGRLDDLEQALALWQQAVAATPPDSPDRPRFLSNLGNGLRDRYARTGRLDDLEQAQMHYATACERGQLLAPEATLTAAQTWGRWASERAAWEEAVRAFEFGLATVEQLHQTQLRRSNQETWLSSARGLHMYTAYALVRAAQPGALRRAVEVAELGRARGLGETLARDRADLALIERDHPDIYERYRATAETVRFLERADRAAEAQQAQPEAAHFTELAARIRAARAELDKAIDAIRALAGYEGFLLPPAYAEITAAAQPGVPLVYLITTPQGSMALIVPYGAAEPEALLLNGFTEDDLNALLIERANDEVVGGYLPGQFLGGAALAAALERGLPRLGAALIAPLAARLRALAATGVTLIPTGLLSLLPLHAATYPVNGQPCCLLDEFDVAYAPSARVLATAQRELQRRSNGALRLAGVGNPTGDLRYAGTELASICDLLPRNASAPLYEQAATRDALWANLPGATIAHFSCHGQFDADDTLDSALLLAQGSRLTLRELVAGDTAALAHVRLAVLSACQTAITDFQRLPDESIGLPGGFLQAGVPAVVGSLWSINDLSTALLMHRFYELHLTGDLNAGLGPRPPARALRLAQVWLRDLTYGAMFDYLERHRQLRATQRLLADGGATAPARIPFDFIATGRAIAEEGMLDDPSQRPYASPIYWAAFTFNGALAGG